MDFECRKTENCLADSQIYEYKLPITVREFKIHLNGWTVEENHRYRRPMMIAMNRGLQIKGILDRYIITVRFPEDTYSEAKMFFEAWLKNEEN
ncbi:hypothetical protein NXG27_07930 [Megasphaera paucivorans]|uniref:Uncharacterized protein n=1 Tax=Megasphaera paucivorans TaxID=349095 RepID=A0A1G9XVQ1_9FIRM|nr:hypothetical protein [Megasphaera paucivorans]SDN00313.1 hypothetical protein SAMN05660299_01927 [Megasphaera paucivorans]